jgi:phenylalanyl-tRNA synthetase beta chain
LAAASEAAGPLLKRTTVFDVYTGNPIPAGKKNIALGFTFQAADRTLTDDETQTQWDKILRRLQKEFGAQLR